MTMRSRPGGREPSTDLAALPAREAEFVRQYVVDCNGAAAARRCGYTPKTAARQAHRLLAKPTVRRAITSLLTERGDYLDGLRARVIEETARAAFADPREVWTQDEDGHLQLRPLADLPSEVAGTIAELSSKQWEGGSSARARQVGKADSLKLLSKLLGMHVDKVELSGTLDIHHFEAARESLLVKLSVVSDEIRTDTHDRARQDRAAIARLEQALAVLEPARRKPLLRDLARWTARVEADLADLPALEAP